MRAPLPCALAALFTVTAPSIVAPAAAQSTTAAKGLGLQAKAIARANAVAVRTGGLSFISRDNCTMGAGSGQVTTGGTIATVARIRHQNLTGKPVASVAFLYAHYAPASGVEGASNYQIQVKAAVEPLGTVTDQTTNPAQPMFFGGARQVTLDRYATVVTDEEPVALDPNGYIYERSAITSPTSSATYGRCQIARGGTTSAWAANSGEGIATTDLTDSGTIGGNTSAAYSASAMLGRLADGTVATSEVTVGDSIACGTDDEQYGTNAGGWPHRAFLAWPGANFCIAGEKLSDVVSGTLFRPRFRATRWATHIVNEYGRNDLNAGQSVATMKANALTFAAKFMRRGQVFVQATVMPAPTSTDGWFGFTSGVLNQTKETNDATRVAFNQWVRDPGSSGFVAQAKAQVASIPYAGGAAFIDPTAGYETNSAGALTQDGGYILPSQSAVLTSGTATSVAATTITDTGKAWTTNAYAGVAVYINGGTGAGQMRTILSNSATTLTVGLSFSPALDATSTYQVYDAIGMVTAVHPTSTGARLAAAAVNAAKVMAVQ